MKISREIIAGGIAGLALGLILRCAVIRLVSPDEAWVPKMPSQEPVAFSQSVEIRQEATAPSAGAQAAVEAGEVKFVISGRDSNDAGGARILLELGSLPVCQNGTVLSIWKESENQWTPARSATVFSGYSISRAWTLPNPIVLGQAAKTLPASTEVFLILPTDEEMRILGAVERALQPHLLRDYNRIELTLEKTPAGHARWTLRRALRRDNTQLSPGMILPI